MPSLDIFLKLDGIEGESTVKEHEKEFAVLSCERIRWKYRAELSGKDSRQLRARR